LRSPAFSSALGTGKTASPRDPARLGRPLVEQVSVKTGRLIRAMNNHFEALILFTIATRTPVSPQSALGPILARASCIFPPTTLA